MAGEEIFVANALIAMVGVLVFTVMFWISYREKNTTLQYIWLSGILLVMTYAFTVQRTGFNATGLYDLRDLSFSILEILIWIFMGIFLLTVIAVFNLAVQALMKMLRKDESYESEN